MEVRNYPGLPHPHPAACTGGKRVRWRWWHGTSSCASWGSATQTKGQLGFDSLLASDSRRTVLSKV